MLLKQARTVTLIGALPFSSFCLFPGLSPLSRPDPSSEFHRISLSEPLAQRMLGDAASVSSRAKKKGREAELLAQGSAKVRARDMTPGASMSSGPGGGLA